ncbi:MAG TPA: hypothetical protein VHE12_05345 [bacterium]|nr:hypothetical protein [bacterium]
MKPLAILICAMLLSSILSAPVGAAPNRITPVIDDQAFESNFKKGVEESVTLKDGRVVDLHGDFTWDYAQPGRKQEGEAPAPAAQPAGDPRTAAEAVEVWDTTLDKSEVNGSDAVRLFLHYQNNSSRKVVGVSVTVRITNSFHKLLFQFSHDDEVSIDPGEKMRNDAFFVWKDNPYINGEPYDLLWESAKNGTARVSVQVRKVVFDDGTVLTNAARKK